MSKDDLFNNDMVKAAKAAMSKEDIEKYAALGESMYKDIDFENGTIANQLEDAVRILEIEIKSGLHPTMMSENEKKILQDKYGEKWYDHFGFTEKDLTEI